MGAKLKGIYLLERGAYDVIYGEAERRKIGGMVEIYAERQDGGSVAAQPGVLGEAAVILSGWGCPRMDEAFLRAAPRLRAVFYGAGSIRGWVTDAVWERGIVVSSAYAANAVPVAEWTVSQIVLSLKQAWFYVLEGKRRGAWLGGAERKSVGGYGSVVGLVSLGVIGRRVAEMLRSYDVHVIAYDPYVSAAEEKELGVAMVGLAEVFSRADVVSLHTPWLAETEGLITGALIGSMKEGATLINTARGAVVREAEMVEVLERRADLTAVLDVTHPEPPAAGSKLYTLPNVVLTPHIAGSIGPECARMGRYMVEELGRWLRGEKLKWEVTRERAARMA